MVVRPADEAEEEKKKFKVLKWRWIVERTFAWLGRYRRLSKDYEGSEESSESWIYLAMTHLMLRGCRRCVLQQDGLDLGPQLVRDFPDRFQGLDRPLLPSHRLASLVSHEKPRGQPGSRWLLR